MVRTDFFGDFDFSRVTLPNGIASWQRSGYPHESRNSSLRLTPKAKASKGGTERGRALTYDLSPSPLLPSRAGACSADWTGWEESLGVPTKSSFLRWIIWLKKHLQSRFPTQGKGDQICLKEVKEGGKEGNGIFTKLGEQKKFSFIFLLSPSSVCLSVTFPSFFALSD